MDKKDGWFYFILIRKISYPCYAFISTVRLSTACLVPGLILASQKQTIALRLHSVGCSAMIRCVLIWSMHDDHPSLKPACSMRPTGP